MKKKSPLNFSADGDAGKALYEWWQSLENFKGDRADLRRCGSVSEVVFVPAFHRLRHTLLALGWVNDEGLAAVAGIVSHVKSHVPAHSFAEQMAQPKSSGTGARVSGLRFRRLLQRRNHEELYPVLIRVIKLLDGAVNINSAAVGSYWWNDSTRKQLAYDYYAAAPIEP
ncbi:MAG: type I-E CRISPR-associated protein Cse2/CasB [Desulfomonilaceae bacterium]